MDSLLSVQQAATHLGVSASLLNQYRVNGKGPAFYKLGKFVRYDREEIECWARSRRYKSTSEAAA